MNHFHFSHSCVHVSSKHPEYHTSFQLFLPNPLRNQQTRTLPIPAHPPSKALLPPPKVLPQTTSRPYRVRRLSSKQAPPCERGCLVFRNGHPVGGRHSQPSGVTVSAHAAQRLQEETPESISTEECSKEENITQWAQYSNSDQSSISVKDSDTSKHS